MNPHYSGLYPHPSNMLRTPYPQALVNRSLSTGSGQPIGGCWDRPFLLRAAQEARRGDLRAVVHDREVTEAEVDAALGVRLRQRLR